MPTPSPESEIRFGYQPGIIGAATDMHARFYSRNAGFGLVFESKLATEFAEFAGRLNKPCNGVWSAARDGRIVGTVAIDGEDMGAGVAHLRWFIVDDGLRGLGVGGRLLGKAMAFCDSGPFREAQLWTFQGLDAARCLYELHGFRLAEERPGQQWGSEVLEQRFVRARAP